MLLKLCGKSGQKGFYHVFFYCYINAVRFKCRLNVTVLVERFELQDVNTKRYPYSVDSHVSRPCFLTEEDESQVTLLTQLDVQSVPNLVVGVDAGHFDGRSLALDD